MTDSPIVVANKIPLLNDFVEQYSSCILSGKLLDTVRDFVYNVTEINKTINAHSFKELSDIAENFEKTYSKDKAYLLKLANILESNMNNASTKEKSEIKTYLEKEKTKFSDNFIAELKSGFDFNQEEETALQYLAYDIKNLPKTPEFIDNYKAVFIEKDENLVLSHDAILKFNSGYDFLKKFILSHTIIEDKNWCEESMKNLVLEKDENENILVFDSVVNYETKKAKEISFSSFISNHKKQDNIKKQPKSGSPEDIANLIMLLGQDLLDAAEMMGDKTDKKLLNFEKVYDARNYKNIAHKSDAMIKISIIKDRYKLIQSLYEKSSSDAQKDVKILIAQKEKKVLEYSENARNSAKIIKDYLNVDQFKGTKINPLERFINPPEVFEILETFAILDFKETAQTPVKQNKRAICIEFNPNSNSLSK